MYMYVPSTKKQYSLFEFLAYNSSWEIWTRLWNINYVECRKNLTFISKFITPIRYTFHLSHIHTYVHTLDIIYRYITSCNSSVLAPQTNSHVPVCKMNQVIINIDLIYSRLNCRNLCFITLLTLRLVACLWRFRIILVILLIINSRHFEHVNCISDRNRRGSTSYLCVGWQQSIILYY